MTKYEVQHTVVNNAIELTDKHVELTKKGFSYAGLVYGLTCKFRDYYLPIIGSLDGTVKRQKVYLLYDYGNSF